MPVAMAKSTLGSEILQIQKQRRGQVYCYRCPLARSWPGCGMACADEVERIFEARRGKVAALVLEPVMQGADGMIAQPPGYVRRMREICDRHGALLVCDEVATGFGRTGTMFAVEQIGRAHV